MNRRLALAAVILLGLLGSAFVAQPSAHAAVGFSINNGRLVDVGGNPFVMRGVSHAHTWFQTQTSSFANVKAKGANALRVVLSGGRWPANSASDVANVVSLCRTNRLVCVLENHDTTGFGEQSDARSLDQAVSYWTSIQSVLTGTENYIIVNIGNEPYGNTGSVSNWTADTSAAIRRLRTAGFQHTIMVDAPNWGQDWQFVMRDNAQTVFNADTARNTIFSIHMYGVFDTAAEITAYVSSFRTRNLPLVIGEFGFNHSDGNPDEDTIMSAAQSQGIGYLGWSWSGNGGGVEYLDMVTGFNPNSLTSWGTRIFTGANGIASTARECVACFGATPSNPQSSPPRSSSRPPNSSPPVSSGPGTPGGCTVAFNQNPPWNTGYTVNLRITNNGTTPINGWSLVFTLASGQAISGGWNATYAPTSGQVTATNVGYNATIPAGGSVQDFGFQATHTGNTAEPTAFTLNGRSCTVV